MNIPTKKKELIELYESWYGEKLMKKVVVMTEEEVYDENFKNPTSYYIVDAIGSMFFFKTNSRAKATELSNEMFGNNKYTVKRVVKAECR